MGACAMKPSSAAKGSLGATKNAALALPLQACQSAHLTRCLRQSISYQQGENTMDLSSIFVVIATTAARTVIETMLDD